jgi:hypothetical protein
MCIVPSSEKSAKEDDHSGSAMICATEGDETLSREREKLKNCGTGRPKPLQNCHYERSEGVAVVRAKADPSSA